MVFAIALIVLIVGSVLFHVLSPWYLTPLASNWSTIDFTIDVTFWVTGFVFVAVNAFMAYCIIRFRYNKNKRSAYQPENKKLEIWLTVVTAIGVAAMLAPGLIVWADFVTVPEDAHEVEAVGQQWHWSYRLPGDDGKFGNVARHEVPGWLERGGCGGPYGQSCGRRVVVTRGGSSSRVLPEKSAQPSAQTVIRTHDPSCSLLFRVGSFT